MADQDAVPEVGRAGGAGDEDEVPDDGSAGDGRAGEPTSSDTKWWHTLLGLAMVVAIIAAIVWVVYKLVPDEVPVARDPGFIDNIFASPFVVAAARVVVLAAAGVLLFGGVYIVVSVSVRMAQREWLRRAGPFESQVLEERLEQAEDYFSEWMEALEESEQLANQVAERDDMIEQLLRDRSALLEELERRGGI